MLCSLVGSKIVHFTPYKRKPFLPEQFPTFKETKNIKNIWTCKGQPMSIILYFIRYTICGIFRVLLIHTNTLD